MGNSKTGGSLNKGFSLFFVMLLLAHVLAGQTGDTKTTVAPSQQQTAQPAAPQQEADTSNFTSAKGFVLEEATPVKLRFNRTVSSADAHVGDTVDFEVLQDISVNGTLVIPKGGFAFGTVTEAQPKRRMARGGKLEINIDYVKLLSSEKAALRAVKGGKGGGHTGAMTAGIVATGIVFFPAAPLFLFIHGKDITMPKGAEFTAYINGDMKLDIAKFQASTPAPQQDLSASSHDQNVSPASAKLQIDSTPPGADIEVDGSYLGSTPSDVQVTEGDHTVVVKKPGFKNWERKLKTSAGSSVRISAELEKADNP
jgi:predicted lipid-binding transport protein (Tim44 family)